MIKESSKERPRIKAKGAISMLPDLSAISTVALPKCLIRISRTGKAQGATLSRSSPGRIPMSLPTETIGRVITIFSIFLVRYMSEASVAVT